MAFSQEMPTALLLADMENETKKKKKKIQLNTWTLSVFIFS